MKKKSCRGRKNQYQKEKQYYLIFKMLNPCYMINSNFSTQTTAFSLHQIFLFPLCKQWGGAKGHILEQHLHCITPQRAEKPQKGPPKSDCPGSSLVTATNPLQPAPGDTPGSHTELRTDGSTWGKLCGVNSQSHTGTATEEQPEDPNQALICTTENIWPGTVLM